MKKWIRKAGGLLVVLLTIALMPACAEKAPAVTTETTGKEEIMEQTYHYRFSFFYGGKHSASLLPTWDHTVVKEQQNDLVVQTDIWTDPKTGLRIIQETKTSQTHASTEWVLWLENTSNEKTELIQELKVADFSSELDTQNNQKVTLAYSKGTDIREDDFLFVEKKLKTYGNLTFSPNGGRSSSGDCMPYFNLYTENGGWFYAIGWTGHWKASFERSKDGVSVVAGMEKTNFVLYPGEKVRTPSFAMLQWTGDNVDSYNLWRAYMIDYHTPKDDAGEAVVLPVTNGAWGGDSVQNHRNTITFIGNQGYDYDAYWVDAGWYGEQSRHSSDQYGDEWFKNAGDWYHNTTLYPNGLLPVSQAAHEAGMDFLLWFEPERAWCDSRLVQEHPDWFLVASATENTSYLFNMANEEARIWMTDFISGKIQEYGVDIYRQDFNFDPLPFWEKNDTQDRQGITEMKYIEGLYAYLDGLLDQNPGLILDNCAGGGRRLDYEILTRALPMFRSDYQCFDTYKTTPCQVQTDGLSHWVPLSGTCVQNRPGDTYSFRSNLAYAVQFPATGTPAWQTSMLDQFHKAQPFFTGSYYRLTDGDVTDSSQWYVYQMDREDLHAGFLLAFRREDCKHATITVRVRIPENAKSITFTDVDTSESWSVEIFSGNSGELELELRLPDARTSQLIFYEVTT